MTVEHPMQRTSQCGTILGQHSNRRCTKKMPNMATATAPAPNHQPTSHLHKRHHAPEGVMERVKHQQPQGARRVADWGRHAPGTAHRIHD